MRLLLPFLTSLAVAACATPAAPGEPSLAPRPAEAVDPRLPVEAAVDPRPVDPSLEARIAALVSQGRDSASAFAAAEPAARTAAAGAGPRESESWIAAQLALSELESRTGPLSAALAELDEIQATRLSSLSAADLAALEAARSALGALADRHAATLAEIRERLAR